ncbi:MAG: LamG domain-containing protein, partial [Kofleriaceae bacterium]
FDVEQWAPGGRSPIWVKVPLIDGSSTTDSILMHFGAGTGASNLASDLVWTGYELVSHMGTTVVDAANTYDGTVSNTTGGEGQIGPATIFTDNGQEVRFATADALLTGWDAWTLELWLRPTYGSLMEAERSNEVIGKGAFTSIQDGRIERQPLASNLWFQIDVHFSTGPSSYLNTNLPLNAWTHISYTHDGTALRLYKNGALVQGPENRGATLDTTPDDIVLGGGSPMFGAIDELRISNAGFSADWIRAQHLSMTGQFVTFTDP